MIRHAEIIPIASGVGEAPEPLVPVGGDSARPDGRAEMAPSPLLGGLPWTLWQAQQAWCFACGRAWLELGLQAYATAWPEGVASAFRLPD